jgi:hypothetical protein
MKLARMKLKLARMKLARMKLAACFLFRTALAITAVALTRPTHALENEPAPIVIHSAVRFGTDVVPVLTKLGCNSGACHGKATGQNGFKLSLLGFEPDMDYRAIVKTARGRRISVGAPNRSLLLAKATNQIPHGGGRRMVVNSDEYSILRRWVSQGALPPLPNHPRVERIELQPAQATLAVAADQTIVVRAFLSDGTSRDVSRQAVYESNEPEIATVNGQGLIETLNKSGLFSIMVRYSGQIATFHAAVTLRSQPSVALAVEERLAELENSQLASPIDRLLIQQWRRLGVTPSIEVDDATFMRRASLDICGTLPTLEDLNSYVSDKREDKRIRLIDSLLERPEYASYFGLKWADILQNRGSGYSTSKQRPGTASFARWIRDAVAQNKPYDDFVAEIITASGSQVENPPAIWYRQVRTETDFVESVAQAFLGVRIQCAQCHHHPFDRWSQADYYGLAAIYASVGRKGGFADAEVPTDEIIYVKQRGTVKHPRSGEVIEPKALGGPEFQLSPYDDPRQDMVRWMTLPENPFFARTMVNRMWAHFHGRGIIHPIDDARSSNPPTNPALLDELARGFVESGYDTKQLLRTICNSYSYRLSASPNELNAEDTQSYARYYPRRMSAEVLLDAISQVLEVPTSFSGGPGAIPLGTRAIDLPDENVPASFLDAFGRPARTSACECERVGSPSLAQALTLINSPEIQRKLSHSDGYATKLSTSGQALDANASDIFVKLLGREPTARERSVAVEFLTKEKGSAAAYQSLLWSLLATNEFMFNH